MTKERFSLFAAVRSMHERARGVRTPDELAAFLDDFAAMVADTLGWAGVVVNLHRRAFDDFFVVSVHGDEVIRTGQLGASRTWTRWNAFISERFERRGVYHVPADERAAIAAASDDFGGISRLPGRARLDGYVVPMCGADGDVNGILAVEGPRGGHEPGEDALDALVAVADAAGAAIESVRVAMRDDEHRRSLEHLLAVSTRLADARSTEVVLDAVCDGIGVALGFERVAILLRDAAGEALHPVAATGWRLSDAALRTSFAIDVLEQLMCPPFEDHGCYLVEREVAERTTGLASTYRSKRNGSGPWAWRRHWLIVPLRGADGALVGAIWCDDPRDCLLPDTRRLQALRLFADQAQAALAAARSYEETLHAAEHDGLTGLPNRRSLLERLDRALASARGSDRTVAVLFVDLDRFKAINDTYGHEAGDQVLRTVAARLDAQIRPGDTVARLGGDEFVVVCEQVTAADDALDVAGRLRSAVAEPIALATQTVSVTACVGIALPSGPEDGARGLLRDADVAMYRAKQASRDAVQLADVVLRAGASARARLERALHGALGREEIEVHWQPIVDLASGLPVRVEALLRWSHPGLGRVPPAEFIPLAEETGAILSIGAWVIDRACEQAAAWRESLAGGAPSVAINLSPHQLRSPTLVEDLARAIDRHGLAPGSVTAEITEGVLLDAGPATVEALAALRGLGVTIELDDFGTGYSSLSSLERFRVDGLKIDRSFVSGRERKSRAGAVVEAVLHMARALGVRVTAEGVETPEQLAWLRELGCEEGQGYLFARPAPAERIAPLLGRTLAPEPAGSV
ncbi:MAG TPA: sensor domain-containing phosphodiesterase [Solirubrobacteraceae bacterium]|nr:sensor domain-containing phosphodiesterase [Solirubrobacteraceae bacterium]